MSVCVCDRQRKLTLVISFSSLFPVFWSSMYWCWIHTEFMLISFLQAFDKTNHGAEFMMFSFASLLVQHVLVLNSC